MKFNLKSTLTIFFLSISFYALSNDSASVRFTFDTSLNTNKFFITLYDGINEYNIDPKSNRCWCGELYSPFGYIEIGYENSDTSRIVKSVFFKKGSSTVYFNYLPNVNEYYSIDEKSSINIIPYDKMGGAALDSFIKDKVDIRKDFMYKNRTKLGINTYFQQACTLSDSIMYKKIEFIRRFPNLYLSFWTFQNAVVKTNILSPDTLLKFYNFILTDDYKKSKAAEYLVKVLQNKIMITSNNNFPDFSVTDSKENKIELSKLRGKYVLIQIWATWCSPCLKEMPDLKSINDKYKDSEFKLISFCVDKNFSAFQKAIEKYSMNWAQVFGDNHLYNSLAQIPIPQVYLVDKTGLTIYNRDTLKDSDLVLLKKLLLEHLNK